MTLAGTMWLGSAPVYAQSITPTAPTVTVTQNGVTWTLIQNADQLAYVDQNPANYLDADLALTGDIDMTGYAWTPLGSSKSSPFSGIFYGQGYTITGLTVTSSSRYVGVFGVSDGTIEDLQVSASVTVTVSPSFGYNGALVGVNEGTITHSNSAGSVTASGQQAQTGGLIGENFGGTVDDSYSTATVTSTGTDGAFSGGLVGRDFPNGISTGSISDSYATGAVTGPEQYATNAGLVGYNSESAITDSYATGPVTGSDATNAGLVGSNQEGTISDSYFDTTTTGQSVGIAEGTSTVGATGEITSAMQQESTYTGWDFSTVWSLSSTVNDGYPSLLPVVTPSLQFPTLTAPSVAVSGFWSPQAFSQIVWAASNTTAQAPANWTLTFLNSSTGFMTIGSAITLQAPLGTQWPASPSDYVLNGQPISSVTVNTAGSVTLGVPTYIAPGSTVTVTIASVVNPSAGTYAATDSGVSMGIAGLSMPVGIPTRGWTFTSTSSS